MGAPLLGGLSSVGRAIALQAIGQGFDPLSLHQYRLPRLNPRKDRVVDT